MSKEHRMTTLIREIAREEIAKRTKGNSCFSEMLDKRVTTLEKRQERMELYVRKFVRETKAKFTTLSGEPPSVLATSRCYDFKARQGYSWSTEEDRVLEGEIAEAISEISLKHKRTTDAIKCRIQKLKREGKIFLY